ncbi:MAG: hypothetical protein GX428_04775 [Candidatus Atribacteria bacterium]|nr:hypothetical protein [Candidatus Atribacteria bacterium]
MKYRYEFGYRIRAMARILRLSHNTVLDYFHGAKAFGIPWPIPEGIDDETLERMLFP